MTTTPAAPLVPDVVPPISLDVAILHRGLNQAKRSLDDLLETFHTVALDVAHQTEVVARMEAELAAARAAEVKALQAKEQAERAAAYAERNKPVPFTPEELKAARAVRTMYGWDRVVKVNAKTVTVLGDFGNYRVPITSILEIRL